MKSISANCGTTAIGTESVIGDGIARSESGHTSGSNTVVSGSTKKLNPVGSAIKLVGMIPTKKIMLSR